MAATASILESLGKVNTCRFIPAPAPHCVELLCCPRAQEGPADLNIPLAGMEILKHNPPEELDAAKSRLPAFVHALIKHVVSASCRGWLPWFCIKE